jgi:hypothetical protein
LQISAAPLLDYLADRVQVARGVAGPVRAVAPEPSYMNYFVGGANTIRGYAVTDLGGELSGKNQLLGTAEYSLTLVPLRRWDIWKISLQPGAEVAVFADAGMAWTESRELAIGRARGGLGGGLRLLVPGSEMVRLDARCSSSTSETSWNSISGLAATSSPRTTVKPRALPAVVPFQIVQFIDLSLELTLFLRSHDEVAEYPNNDESQEGQSIRE